MGSNDNQNLLTSKERYIHSTYHDPGNTSTTTTQCLKLDLEILMGHNFTIVNQSVIMEDVLTIIMSGFSKEMYTPCPVSDCYTLYCTQHVFLPRARVRSKG